MRNAQLKTRRYPACLPVLAAGLCSAAPIYAFIDDAPATALFLFAAWLPADGA